MKIFAPAKVNLALDVIGQRTDGYHELDMIMAPISLYDEIDIEKSETMKVIVEGMQLPEENTITKMVRLCKERFSLDSNYSIRVIKKIPSQAGLAGGSADAAAVFRAILQLEDLKVSLDQQLELAKEVGADVPFCMVNQYARVQGIGEKITPIQSDWTFKILLVKPSFGISTPASFKLWHEQEPFHADVDYTQMAIENESLDLLVQAMNNALEPVAFTLRKEMADIKEAMLDAGMVRVMMSGSGSSLMGFCSEEEVFDQAVQKLKDQYEFVQVVTVGEAKC